MIRVNNRSYYFRKHSKNPSKCIRYDDCEEEEEEEIEDENNEEDEENAMEEEDDDDMDSTDLQDQIESNSDFNIPNRVVQRQQQQLQKYSMYEQKRPQSRPQQRQQQQRYLQLQQQRQMQSQQYRQQQENARREAKKKREQLEAKQNGVKKSKQKKPLKKRMPAYMPPSPRFRRSPRKRITAELVTEAALRHLGDTNSSTLQDIRNFVFENFPVSDEVTVTEHIQAYLQQSLENGRIIKINRNFKFSARTKAELIAKMREKRRREKEIEEIRKFSKDLRKKKAASTSDIPIWKLKPRRRRSKMAFKGRQPYHQDSTRSVTGAKARVTKSKSMAMMEGPRRIRKSTNTPLTATSSQKLKAKTPSPEEEDATPRTKAANKEAARLLERELMWKF